MSNPKDDEVLSEMTVFLREKIDSSGKSLRELAREMGFNNPNFISMLKSGYTKVPLDKVIPIAKALEIDPGQFMRIALGQVFVDRSDEVWNLFDGIGSYNETNLIRAVRAAYDGNVPAFTEPQIEEVVALLARLNPPQRVKGSRADTSVRSSAKSPSGKGGAR